MLPPPNPTSPAHIRRLSLVPTAFPRRRRRRRRSNLAFAVVELEREFGFDNAVFGLAAGVFFASYASAAPPARGAAALIDARRPPAQSAAAGARRPAAPAPRALRAPPRAGLQIPSQLLAVRLGGPAMLGLLAVAWGAVSAGMAGVCSTGGLIAQRVLLGAAEAGALPAMWMVNSQARARVCGGCAPELGGCPLHPRPARVRRAPERARAPPANKPRATRKLLQWFPTHRLTIPSTCVMLGITAAQAVSGPLAAGLLALHQRVGGLKGWQIMVGRRAARAGAHAVLPSCCAHVRQASWWWRRQPT